MGPPGSVKPVADQKSIRSKGPASSIQVVTTRHVVKSERRFHSSHAKGTRCAYSQVFVCECADCESGMLDAGGSFLFTCPSASRRKEGLGLGGWVQRYKPLYNNDAKACAGQQETESNSSGNWRQLRMR